MKQVTMTFSAATMESTIKQSSNCLTYCRYLYLGKASEKNTVSMQKPGFGNWYVLTSLINY